MGRYLVATIKSWNIENYINLQKDYPEHEFFLVNDRDKLTLSVLESVNPSYIFFPHWSWIIPKSIFENYNCVVFHMTDLPFGRGGSPLQNLLERGIYLTKISALKVSSGVDTGPIYFKEPIDISEGNADEILRRISNIVFEKMIPRFFSEALIPVEQEGNPVTFMRRTPEQSEIPEGLTQRQLYDFIRMLDGEGYPAAYRRLGNGKILFTDANLTNGVLDARASFVEDESI